MKNSLIGVSRALLMCAFMASCPCLWAQDPEAEPPVARASLGKTKKAPIINKSEKPQAVKRSSSVNAGGFKVSLSYLSLPITHSYFEITEQITMVSVPYPSPYTVAYFVADEIESFSQSTVGLRFAGMRALNNSVSAGIEWGFSLPVSEEKLTDSAGQTVMGSTQTVRHRGGLSVWSTDSGPVSVEVKVKSVVVPLFAKMDFKIANSLFVGVGLGTYLTLTSIETTSRSYDNIEKNMDLFPGVTPALELSVGGKGRVLDNIHLTVAGSVGYSSKTVLKKQEERRSDYSYKDSYEIGGLFYGGNVGLSFLF